MFFLLTPYEKRGEETIYIDGFMGLFAEEGLNEYQVRHLNRIRTIRNNVSHDRVDKGDPID